MTPTPPGRRSNRYQSASLRTLQIGVGLVLTATGVFGLLFLLNATRGGGAAMFVDPSMWMAPDRIRRRAIYVGGLWLSAFAGLNLMAGRKPTILFLRHFGVDINLVVSRAIASGLGRRFRFVTLDDGRFPALETPRLERWLSRLAAPLAVAALLLWTWMLVPGLARVADYGPELLVETAAMVSFWFTGACILLAPWLAHLWRVRRRATRSIVTDGDVARVLGDVAAIAGITRRLTMLAPQATVVQVMDTVWQRAVSAGLATVDAVLIDVSVPSPSLQWELEQVRDPGIPAP